MVPDEPRSWPRYYEPRDDDVYESHELPYEWSSALVRDHEPWRIELTIAFSYGEQHKTAYIATLVA